MSVIVRIEHVREAAICAQGTRRWFTSQGLSWIDFLENGMPAEQVAAMGNPFADRVLEIAMKEAEHGRRQQ